MLENNEFTETSHSENYENLNESKWGNFNVNLKNLHAGISMKKEKIFSKVDFSKRKTKIICTLG